MKRGDVVVADFPFQDMPGSKIRPAIVVQNNADNQTYANTILAMVTGNLTDAGRQTNVLVDPGAPDGVGSGLRGSSLIKCWQLGNRAPATCSADNRPFERCSNTKSKLRLESSLGDTLREPSSWQFWIAIGLA